MSLKAESHEEVVDHGEGRDADVDLVEVRDLEEEREVVARQLDAP